VLPLLISNILSFPEDHPVAAYVLFLVFHFYLSFRKFYTLYDHKIKENDNLIYAI